MAIGFNVHFSSLPVPRFTPRTALCFACSKHNLPKGWRPFHVRPANAVLFRRPLLFPVTVALLAAAEPEPEPEPRLCFSVGHLKDEQERRIHTFTCPS